MEPNRSSIATTSSQHQTQHSNDSSSIPDGGPSVYKYGLPPIAYSSKLVSSPGIVGNNEVRLTNNISTNCIPLENCSNIWVDSNNIPVENNGQIRQIKSSSRSNLNNHSENNSSILIPISHEQHFKRSVPKCRKNTVTLPVPSPPLATTVAIDNGSGIVDSNSKSDCDEVSESVKCSRRLKDDDPGQSSSHPERTLISTEAQTEELTPTLSLAPPPRTRNREHRKRERRERRRHRQPHTHHYHPRYSRSNVNSSSNHQGSSSSHSMEPESRVPSTEESISRVNNGDIEVNTHDITSPPPPYSTLPMPINSEPRTRRPLSVPPSAISPPPPPPLQITPASPTPLHPMPYCAAAALAAMTQPLQNCITSPTQPVRYQFSPPIQATTPNRRSLSLRTFRGIPYSSEEEPKSCCGMSTNQAVSIRWFIIVIAGIGICCTVAGTALGAARSAGSQHLTLSLLMIGVGVVLLTVSAIAWRLTANETGTSSCRAMLGFGRNGSTRGDGGSEPNRVFVPRLPPSYGRPHHPYAAMFYPDFQYRPPPPSYQASMQEYRLRLLLLERSNPTAGHITGNPSGLNLAHPPPAYRPYNATIWSGNPRVDFECSRPPSYQSPSSRAGSHDEVPPRSRNCHPLHIQNTLDPPLHVRNPSLLSFLSQQSIGDSISVVSGGNENCTNSPSGSQVVTVMEVNVDTLGGLGIDFEREHEDRKGEDCRDTKNTSETSIEKEKDGNLVRIVQTTDSSQVIGRDSVIVTVSGSQTHSDQAQLLWDHLHSQHLSNLHHQSTTNQNHNLLHYHLNPPDNNEVQILAHL